LVNAPYSCREQEFLETGVSVFGYESRRIVIVVSRLWVLLVMREVQGSTAFNTSLNEFKEL
jgi:hypothetical protein